MVPKLSLFFLLTVLFVMGCSSDHEQSPYVSTDTVISTAETADTVFEFDPTSEAYQKKFYDSILGPQDTAAFINPAGTYHLGPYTPEGADEPIGNQGDVRVKQLDRHQIAICLSYVSHGPGFNVGYLFDTIEYRNNSAVYHPYYDQSCTVIFRFTNSGVDVSQFGSDPSFTCDFGFNVYVDGFYSKESDEILNIDEDCY